MLTTTSGDYLVNLKFKAGPPLWLDIVAHRHVQQTVEYLQGGDSTGTSSSAYPLPLRQLFSLHSVRILLVASCFPSHYLFPQLLNFVSDDVFSYKETYPQHRNLACLTLG